MELSSSQSTIIMTALLVGILLYNQRAKDTTKSISNGDYDDMPFMEPVPEHGEKNLRGKKNRLGNRGFRCSQKERIPSYEPNGDKSLQDVVENLYQKTVNKVTTNLAGLNRQDAKTFRELKLKASLRPKDEVLQFGEIQPQNIHSNSHYNTVIGQVDRLKRSAYSMQNDVPIAKFTTHLGSSTGASGASRFFHGVREMPAVPLTKGSSSIRQMMGNVMGKEGFNSNTQDPRLIGTDIQVNSLGLGVNNQSSSATKMYSDIGLVDRNPSQFRTFDGFHRFFKGHQKEGGTKNDRKVEGETDIERFGSSREDGTDFSSGVTGHTNSPFIGEVHSQGNKTASLHKQRTYSGRNTLDSNPTKASRGVESRYHKPEFITKDRHLKRGKTIMGAKPQNIYTEYEHSYK